MRSEFSTCDCPGPASDKPASRSRRHGETEVHIRLKRLALLWAQAHRYSACAFEVNLPLSRYRADVAAYRSAPNETRARSSSVPAASGKCKPGAETAATASQTISGEIGTTAIFECKQALVDLRRDNGSTTAIRERLDKTYRRRQVLERNLRIHYPQARIADSLFPEFDSHDFAAIGHKGYSRALRELSALQNRLFDCTKFETLVRNRCANLFYLVLPDELFRESEIPRGWGALVESNGALTLKREPAWHETTAKSRIRFLHRIAAAGTRLLNRQLAIMVADISLPKEHSVPTVRAS
jgi:hypothetical protein